MEYDCQQFTISGRKIMRPYVYVPAAKITGELEPNGHRAGYDSGDPKTAILKFDTGFQTGVWECQPGGWNITPREDTEVCYIVSGRVTVTDGATGNVYEVSAGDVVVQPKGWSGRWEVTETIRKVYTHGFD
jgi:uncharacterized cupin superfamily protein